MGGLFGAIPQPPGPVAGRVLVFDVERFLQGTFGKVTPYTGTYNDPPIFSVTILHEGRYICKANSKYI